ncbi:ATP-dependent RNA helicase HrpA [Nocardioides sp. Root190]|uniref:ATP-dependent RNA helicase HrpA n=1 Tax=Nocardioides sp. Root190 TaxID=1736488 RepID=UPI002285F12C|nr:ATP-dependent RNA helicase HrpA [Nocardioides sp. Root190]
MQIVRQSSSTVTHATLATEFGGRPVRAGWENGSAVDITYPPDLPVSARRDDIAAAIREHQVVIVAGETGSGKTTQLPKICLELGRGAPGDESGRGRPRMIGHTQPRRIAARSVAERIASELDTELGDVVGYQVRFTDKTSKQSRVKVMTDGILLAELQRDRMLRRYDTIIIDEAHERSLNIDFLLGYLKQLLPRRPDLKLVITSATIDTERFAQHFDDAPVIEVSGRTYPVEVRYRPLMDVPEDDEEGEAIVRDQTEAIVDAVKELSAEGPGDILVFLPGEREIRDTAEALAPLGDGIRGVDVLPLYSRLSAADQHKVFAPASGSRRRVVLATNVAETSLTVPGIRYVIDSGVARISRYSARTKVQRLPIEPISQASANQRSGRCGRVAAGIAIRLYAEEDFESRPEFTDPEILRTNLASVILQMTSLGLGDIARFPFVEPPDRRNVQAGVQLLQELGAVSGGSATAPGELTKVGQRLARLPIDPRLGRMLLEAERLACVRDVLVIVAALSLQDPRERPGVDHPKEQAQADQFHARHKAEGSDFLTLLNLWNHLQAQQKELSGSAFRRMCKREFLNYLRVREWQEFVAQLRQVTKEMGVRLEAPSTTPDADGIHQALLSGLLSHIGLLEEREKPKAGARKDGRRPGPREYLGARGAKFAIFPGSGLARKNPGFMMAGELVETGRLWARQNAEIKPEWAERLGDHLVKRSHSEPHWSRKRQAVMAVERVTLYGVPLATDRPVNFGRIDPELSRELFIRHALVYGEWDTRHHFFRDNRKLLAEVEELEHRTRRRDLVVDEHTLFDFYDARVPQHIVSGAHFDRWWRDERRQQPALLTFDLAMLTHDTADEVREADYPEEWSVTGGLSFPISYHFEPGATDDGLTIDIPVSTLNRVDDDDFSWIVPGLREELVVELIRSLPKQLRVNFVPAPNTARDFLAAVPAGQEALLTALERHLRATTGVHVPREAWDLSALPTHLTPSYRVVDEGGKVQGRGKSLAELKAPLQPQFDRALAAVATDSGVARTGETTWVFDDIAETATWTRAGHEVEAFPGLVDEGATVGLQVSGSADERDTRHRLGVIRLLLLALGDAPTKGILDSLSNVDKLGLSGTPYSGVPALLADCLRAVVVDAVDAREPVRTREGYDALLAALRPSVAADVRAVLTELLRVLEVWREVERLLSGRTEMAQLPALTDLQAQLGRMVHDGFVGEAGATRLRRHRTWLAAMRERRQALDTGGAAALAKDRQRMDLVQPMQEAWLARIGALPEGRPPGAGLRGIRWMLEEYRVSLWAQQLGVDGPISDVRLRKAFDALA